MNRNMPDCAIVSYHEWQKSYSIVSLNFHVMKKKYFAPKMHFLKLYSESMMAASSSAVPINDPDTQGKTLEFHADWDDE